MKKRILADYRWMDYRMLAVRLDELAREGWQLQKEGFLGLTFEAIEPAERYHRVIDVPKDQTVLPNLKGWTVVYQRGEKTIMARAEAMTAEEELAADQEMRPKARKELQGNLRQLASFLAMAVMLAWGWYLSDQEAYRQLLAQEPLLYAAVLAAAALLAATIVLILANFLELLRFHWAVSEEIIYVPLWQGYSLRWLGIQLQLILSLAVFAVGAAFLALN